MEETTRIVLSWARGAIAKNKLIVASNIAIESFATGSSRANKASTQAAVFAFLSAFLGSRTSGHHQNDGKGKQQHNLNIIMFLCIHHLFSF